MSENNDVGSAKPRDISAVQLVMAVDRRRLAILGGAAAIRLLLFTFFPQAADLLTERVETSTPVSSFKRLQEGLFLYNHNVSPYDGGVFHQAPLLLSLFALLPDYHLYPTITNVIYVCADLLSAKALMSIAETGESVSPRLYQSPRRNIRWSSAAVGAAYLFNPLTIASCLARSTTLFTNCLILLSVERSVRGRAATSVLALSAASYLSMYPILLLPPLTLLSFDRYVPASPKSNLLAFSGFTSSLATSTISILLWMSYFLTGSSWQFVKSTYGVQLLLPDLTPNVGLWWYFFIEMFDSFREFFLGVFWLHLAGYVAGLCIRIRPQPLFVVTCLTGIFAIFKPYPSISDTSLFVSLIPLYRHIFPLMRYTFFATSALLYAALLGPAFYYLWIYAGSGNANFFYAITLVWSLGLTILLADLVFAVLRDEWEVERPEMRGKEVRQI